MGCFPADEGLDEVTIAKLDALGWTAPAAKRTLISPEIRVQQTAIALNLNSLKANELRECDYGAWSGRSLEEIHAEDPAGLASWLADVGSAPHGGESFHQLITRVGGLGRGAERHRAFNRRYPCIRCSGRNCICPSCTRRFLSPHRGCSVDSDRSSPERIALALAHPWGGAWFSLRRIVISTERKPVRRCSPTERVHD